MLLMYFRLLPSTEKHPPRVKLQAHMGKWKTVPLEGGNKREISLKAARAAGFAAVRVGSVVENIGGRDLDWVAYVTLEDARC